VQILEPAPATGRRALAQPGIELGILDQRLVQRRVEIAGADGIDLQSVAGPVRAHAARQVAHRALGGGVRGNGRSRQFALHAADVDDLAATARDHVPGHRAPHEEDAVQVVRDEGVPVRVSEFVERSTSLYAGVVDQDVERAEMGLDGVDARIDLRGIGYVERTHVHACAGGADHRGGFIQCGLGASVDDHVCASRGQCGGDGVADAARGAGDERAAPGEVEGVHLRILAMPQELAEKACHIEIKVLREPIGKQDQYAASFGGFNAYSFHKDGSVTIEPVNISEGAQMELQNNIFLFYLNKKRSAGDILKDQNKKTKQNDAEVIDRLHKIKDIGLYTRKILEKNKIDEFGDLLHEHWMIKRGISNKISDDYIDEVYEVARKNGALGGKVIGAGGGGFLLFYIPHKKTSFISAMKKMGLVPTWFSFEREGVKIGFYS
jgi:hypothetical protein